MNYYRHHLGDYAKDTSHLSLAEHGAYRLLMDHYYATEKPLPVYIEALNRICGAATKGERAAVTSVVAQFFKNAADRLTHSRIEAEIKEYEIQREKNATNGRRGGRPKETQPLTQIKPTGLILGSENETQTKPSHKPVASSHVLLEKEPKARGPRQPQPTDAEWLASLAAKPAYAGIDIAIQHSKAEAWCAENHRVFSRRFFVNRLNRTEKPLATKPTPEPTSWPWDKGAQA